MGSGFGDSSGCLAPADLALPGSGPGFRDAGVVGVLGLPRAPRLWCAGVKGSRPAGRAAGWTPGRRTGLQRTRARMRVPPCGLSPWLPAGWRLAPPLRAAVTARRAPSPPLPPPRLPPGAATCGPPSRMPAASQRPRLHRPCLRCRRPWPGPALLPVPLGTKYQSGKAIIPLPELLFTLALLGFSVSV